MTEQVTPAAPEAPAQEVSMEQVDALLQADERAEYQGEPETEEPAAEAAPPAPEPEHDPDLPKGDLRVPLREERERRRQAEQYAQQLAQSQRALSGYLEQMARQVAPQQPGEPPVPDFDADPAANLKYQVDTLKGALGQLAQAQQERAAKEQAINAYQAAVASVSNQEAAFAKQQADYYDAVDFMRERQAAKFEALGMPKDQIPDAVTQELRQFGMKALRAGLNPANSLFQLAKVEGYTRPIADAAAKLETVAKGVASTRGARSSAPASNGEMTLDQAARLSYKDLGKMSDDQWQKLMGG